jgi:iron complex transport system substrate-binding protein
MKNCRPPLLPLLLIGALLLDAAPSLAAETVVRQDAMGRKVTLNLPLERVVSLSPSVTEVLFAIGADDRTVGVSKHCDFPIAAKLKPKVGDFNSPDMEKVIAAAPDAVLFTEYARSEDLSSLEGAGIPAFVLPAAKVEDILSTIRTLGEMTERAGSADRLAAAIGTKVEEIGARIGEVSEESRPRVYVEVDGPRTLYAVGPGSFMDDLIRLAGGRNVFAHKSAPYFPVDSGEVVKADPEVILVDYPFQYKVGLTRRPGWDAIDAVRQGKVFDGTDFDIILFNRPGPRIVDSLREIAAILHPEAFRE